MNVIPSALFCIVMFFASIAFSQELPRNESDSSRFKFVSPGLVAEMEGVDSERLFDRFAARLNKEERSSLRAVSKDAARLCLATLEYIEFRTNGYKSFISQRRRLPTGEVRPWSFDLFLGKYSGRTEELFKNAEKQCPSELKKTSNFLAGKFAYAWLRENLIVRMSPLGKETEKTLEIYDEIVFAYKANPEARDFDPIPVLYAYGNSLLRHADFEEAEPLLRECLALATEKYGENSPFLIPILKQLGGIALTAGDADTLGYFARWRFGIDGTPLGESFTLYLLTHRVESDKGKNLISGLPEIAVALMPGSFSTTRLPTNPSGGLRPTTIPSPIVVFPGSSSTVSVVMRPRANVIIDVDEEGKVTSANAQYEDEDMKARLEKLAMELTFRPLIYKGKPTAMRGVIRLNVPNR